MKRKLTIACAALISAGMLFTACKKNYNGNGSTPVKSASVQMGFAVTTDNPSMSLSANLNGSASSLAATSTASIVWTAGTANVSAFKLEARKRGLEVEITSKQLLNIDLFAPLPTLITANIDTGNFTNVELRVELAKSSTNLPLQLKGTFTTSTGATTPIELDFNDNAEIKIEAENINVDGTQDITDRIIFHLDKLLLNSRATDLDNATKTNGTIVISSTSNTNIYNIIKNNLQGIGGFNGFERHDHGHDN